MVLVLSLGVLVVLKFVGIGTVAFLGLIREHAVVECVKCVGVYPRTPLNHDLHFFCFINNN